MKAIKYTGSTPFKDMHSGIQYVFEPNETTMLPDEAAKHMFGIGGTAEDKYLALRRSDNLNNPKWLNQFKSLRIEETVIDPALKKSKKPVVEDPPEDPPEETKPGPELEIVDDTNED